jgi:hypothetical protein
VYLFKNNVNREGCLVGLDSKQNYEAYVERGWITQRNAAEIKQNEVMITKAKEREREESN